MTKKIRKKIFVIVVEYIILGILSFLQPIIIKNIIDKALLDRNMIILYEMTILYFTVKVIEGILELLQIQTFVKLQKQVVLHIYDRAFQKLVTISYDFFMDNNPSGIINVLSTDIENMVMLVDSNMLSIIAFILRIISGLVGLCVICPQMTLIIVAFIPVKYLLMKCFASKKERTVSLWMEKMKEFSSWFGDIINGIREIKLWNMSSSLRKELINRQIQVLNYEKKITLLDTYKDTADTIIQGFVISVLYVVGGVFVFHNEITVGGLTAFVSYGKEVLIPIAAVFNLRLVFSQIFPSIKRMSEFLEIDDEDKSHKSESKNEFNSVIEFYKVGKRYNGVTILKDVSFSIKKYEKVAIWGENGSGKTTLINILLRFISPSEGKIFIDGNNIEEFDLKLYRDMYGVVNQNIFLFQDTIYKNIMMNHEVNEEELLRLIDKFDMEFINSRSIYEDKLKGNGANLSGGERQKIALLRAMMKRSDILILDEATSNMDSKSERLIYETILDSRNKQTVIFITHKKEYLEKADKILKLVENKTVVEYSSKEK